MGFRVDLGYIIILTSHVSELEKLAGRLPVFTYPTKQSPLSHPVSVTWS